MATKKLSTYRGMRDFSKTAEPGGTLPVKGSPQRRFVIQKHAARRLHYDLRLELDGVFQVVGGHTRPFTDAAGQAPRGGSGRPPARLRRLRRHDSERPIRRRHRAAVGSRLLAAPRRAVRRGTAAQGRADADETAARSDAQSTAVHRAGVVQAGRTFAKLRSRDCAKTSRRRK